MMPVADILPLTHAFGCKYSTRSIELFRAHGVAVFGGPELVGNLWLTSVTIEHLDVVKEVAGKQQLLFKPCIECVKEPTAQHIISAPLNIEWGATNKWFAHESAAKRHDAAIFLAATVPPQPDLFPLPTLGSCDQITLSFGPSNLLPTDRSSMIVVLYGKSTAG